MASILRRSCSLAPARRAFSTSTPRLASLQWDANNKEVLADTVPEYPYGPPTLYKQSRRGLYGEQRIRFGNNVSVKGKNKSRRSWRPNIMQKRLFSKALNKHVQIRVSSRVLRTMDKLGGLDEWLLGEKETRIRELGESGWWLRWAIMQTKTVKDRFAAERIALGLPADPKELRVEEEDAEAVLAASTPDAEIAEFTLEQDADPDLEAEPLVSEILAEDDVFQVEQSKDLPPLKFRVARNKYIVLTEKGWRRLAPTAEKRELLHKEKIKQAARGLQKNLGHTAMRTLSQELQSRKVEYEVEVRDGDSTGTIESVTRKLTKREVKRMREALKPAARRLAGKEIDAMVHEKYEAAIEKMRLRKEEIQANRALREAQAKAVEVDSVAA